MCELVALYVFFFMPVVVSHDPLSPQTHALLLSMSVTLLLWIKSIRGNRYVSVSCVSYLDDPRSWKRISLNGDGKKGSSCLKHCWQYDITFV